MERVLLLNITYEPLKVIDWKKAITLLCLGKVEVLEEYNREVRSVSFTLKLPSVVRLLQMIKRPKSRFGSQGRISMRGTATSASTAGASTLARISLMTMSFPNQRVAGRSGRTS